MKEFDKWWVEFNRIPLPADEFDFARPAWKAALEWCLTWFDNDSPCGCDKISAEIIEKELNNE